MQPDTGTCKADGCSKDQLSRAGTTSLVHGDTMLYPIYSKAVDCMDHRSEKASAESLLEESVSCGLATNRSP